ncbi:Serine/threonine-protein kinase wnk4 [Clonorchis sinensis]|uniref:Serine/threonine-protein kinase wnk4 n=1 Tax=Clonorchis sinensis TaxID=79923 RepID=A0A419PU34_CLOSI|nr:Serine/threonine-protein kinase wnk4 [Clonorchis sinensis]
MHHKIQPPILHRDLKADNCFLYGASDEEYLNVKVGDFGLATHVNNSGRKTMLGTLGFMAPEIFDEKYDEKVDIYAFGMLMLEVMTNRTPYDECETVMQVAAKTMSGQGPDIMDKVLNPSLREVRSPTVLYRDRHPLVTWADFFLRTVCCSHLYLLPCCKLFLHSPTASQQINPKELLSANDISVVWEFVCVQFLVSKMNKNKPLLNPRNLFHIVAFNVRTLCHIDQLALLFRPCSLFRLMYFVSPKHAYKTPGRSYISICSVRTRISCTLLFEYLTAPIQWLMLSTTLEWTVRALVSCKSPGNGGEQSHPIPPNAINWTEEVNVSETTSKKDRTSVHSQKRCLERSAGSYQLTLWKDQMNPKVHCAIPLLQCKKSPGPDGLHLALSKGVECALAILTILLQNIWGEERT